MQSGDTVIKGAVTAEVIRSPKELQGYDDILTISSVDIKGVGGNMAHFEVSGR